MIEYTLEITPVHPVTEWLRQLSMSLWAKLHRWAGKIFCLQDQITEITWVDDVRWWIEDKIDPLFSRAYHGSCQEIADCLDGLIPLADWSDRQRGVVESLCTYHKLFPEVVCLQCEWSGDYHFDGLASLARENGECPACQSNIYIRGLFGSV